MVKLIGAFLQLFVANAPKLFSSYVIFISPMLLTLVLGNILNVCHSLRIVVAVTKIVFQGYGISLSPHLQSALLSARSYVSSTWIGSYEILYFSVRAHVNGRCNMMVHRMCWM
jgi:hypothetical protein